MKTDIETRDLSEIKRLLFEVLGVEDYTKVERMGGLQITQIMFTMEMTRRLL